MYIGLRYPFGEAEEFNLEGKAEGSLFLFLPRGK